MDFMHYILSYVIEIAIILFEYMGVIVLIFSGVKGVINFFKHKKNVKLDLARGMAMGLEFKLGGEILRTLVVKDLSELYILAGIVVIRSAITYLIHWEIKNDLHEQKQEQEGCEGH